MVPKKVLIAAGKLGAATTPSDDIHSNGASH